MAAATGQVTTSDGCAIAYRFDGPEEAPVLLLSNSLGTAMGMWDLQIPAFASRFRVLRYDSRGHGASDVPAGAYSMDRLGRDVIELLDALRIEKVSVCGVSKGGMVGQWLGFRAPERIEKLALCNTAAFMGPPAGWDQRITTVLAGGMAALTDAVLDRWFTPEFRDGSPDLVAPVREMLLTTDPRGYAGCSAAIRDMDLRPTDPLIRRPTLVIAGSRDPATPPDVTGLVAALVPGAKLVTLEAAHLSNIEQADGFTKDVLDFLG